MDKQVNSSKSTVTKLALVCVCMFGFGYVLVPLYDVFCDLTGLRFTQEANELVSQEIQEDTTRLVTVEFDVSMNESMPWIVRPAVSKLQVHPGRVYTTNYIAKNTTQSAMVGQAVPSITPYVANRHLVKTECFCFENQPIGAGKEVEMALSFMINPKLPKNVKVVTLSYTFFDITQNKYLNKLDTVNLKLLDSKESVIAFN
jgi:cytochrome c oxidase assembly protein subunit 11|tara:strand:+ start:17 stop:619 length:603 start_codon:yes stop_codon:yes gene_type:complete